MCFEKFSPFTRMVLGALSGAAIGLMSGLLFGYIIGVIYLKLIITTPSPDMGMMEMFPYGQSVFLGMSLGTIIGAILGGIYANKK
ncbi:MAG: hypothetical protein AAB739_00415 [Patescibacteria group bacterium]